MTIFLYNAKGAHPEHLAATEKELKRVLIHHPQNLISVDQSYLDRDLAKMGTVVVFPGGNALHMQAALGETMQKIKTFVDKGGGYLGICAGGYLAASKVDYQIDGTTLSLTFNLGLIDKVVGPAYTDWDQREKPIWSKKIAVGDDDPIDVSWRGGGAFCDGDVVATYADLPDAPAAIVKKGSAVLCGPHPEMGAKAEQGLFDKICALAGIK